MRDIAGSGEMSGAKTSWVGLILLCVTAAGPSCAGPPDPAPGPRTIPDVTAFLDSSRCPDGALAVVETTCVGAAPQRARDPMLMRRHDWPAPDGYQVSDAFEADDGSYFVTTFAYPPFAAFDASHGDGGEIYVTDGVTVRIAATEDGSQMDVVQGFYGAACGGTGWVMFRNDAPTGRWADLVARLKSQTIVSSCKASRSAYTRYRLETVTLPFIINGVRTDLALPTVISERFNAGDIDSARAMERSFMAKGVGRVIWEAWTRRPPAGGDLDIRCPGTTWSTPPGPGWRLSDCRTSTQITTADGSLTGDKYGWPPAGLVLP